jgi:hypothetical protein
MGIILTGKKATKTRKLSQGNDTKTSDLSPSWADDTMRLSIHVNLSIKTDFLLVCVAL